MNTQKCEIIGCEGDAAVVRVGEGNGLLEDYLCEECYHILQGWFPERASCYTPVTEHKPRFVVRKKEKVMVKVA